MRLESEFRQSQHGDGIYSAEFSFSIGVRGGKVVAVMKLNENNKRSFNKKINKMTEVEKVIKQGQKDAAEKLRLLNREYGKVSLVMMYGFYC
jgi:hypothetical protein